MKHYGEHDIRDRLMADINALLYKLDKAAESMILQRHVKEVSQEREDLRDMLRNIIK